MVTVNSQRGGHYRLLFFNLFFNRNYFLTNRKGDQQHKSVTRLRKVRQSSPAIHSMHRDVCMTSVLSTAPRTAMASMG